MRLALLCPVHGQSIDHIARQLGNYRVFLSPFRLRHYLHISQESSPELKHDLLVFAEQEGHDIVITQKSRRTWRTCTANALCELIKTVITDDAVYDKVLLHTDTDLLFSSDAKNRLQAHPIGCGDKPSALHEQHPWNWTKQALTDPRIKRMITELLDGDPSKLRRGRVCGAFMAWTIFETFGVLYNYFFDDSYFDRKPHKQWPVTEIAIPTVLRYLQGPEFLFQFQLIDAPRNKEFGVDYVKKLIANRETYGVKKLASKPDSDAYGYVMKLQAEAARQL